MVLKNFKRLLVLVAIIVVAAAAYGLLTMKENRNQIGITSGAIRKLYPNTDTDNPRP